MIAWLIQRERGRKRRELKVLEIAIEKLKALPEDRQAYAAEVIEQIAPGDSGVFQIPEEHMKGVLDQLAPGAER